MEGEQDRREGERTNILILKRRKSREMKAVYLMLLKAVNDMI